MGNMSYCRFENTYRDLLDCYDAMPDGEENLSENEIMARRHLIELCQEISVNYGQDEEKE